MNKKLNLNYVSEIIGEDYRNWNKGDIVKIKAQTGTGKTFFITGDKNTKGLIDKIENKNLLYICNRIELKRQVKLDLLKKFEELHLIYKDDNTDKKDIIIVENMKYDINKLDKLKDIHNVTVTSYQELAERELDNIYYNTNHTIENYDYIVCDECHFFLTDAGFNSKSFLSFFNIVKGKFENSIRIFVSATIDEVERAIEISINENNEIWNYDTNRDYSYLNTKYFKKLDDIVTTIKNDRTDDKWLIFVKNKKEGIELSEKLQALNIDVEFIRAKVDSKEKKNITSNNEFDCRVLISTKVLDNGVNIKDDSVKNIAVMSYDETTFIQEIGRLRIDINNAREINLYIPTFSYKNFAGKLKIYNKKIEQLNLFETDRVAFNRKYNNDMTRIYDDLFIINKSGDLEINMLSYDRLYKDKNFAEKMIMLFEGGIEMMDGTIEKFDCDYKDKFAYVKEQLKWLGLEDTFSEDNLIEMVVDGEEIDQLKKYLESMVGKRLYSEEQQELSNLIINELITISKDTDYRTKKLKPSTIEKILREDLNLDYAISKSKREDRVINGQRIRRNYIEIVVC